MTGYKKIAQIGKVAFYEKEGTLPIFNKILIDAEGFDFAILPYEYKAKEGQYLITYDPLTDRGIALTIDKELAILNYNEYFLFLAAVVEHRTAVNKELLQLLTGSYSMAELRNLILAKGRPLSELL